MNFDKIPFFQKVHLLSEDPMLQRNNSTSLYSVPVRLVDAFYKTENNHSLTVIFQNPHFYPDYYLKTI